MDLILSQTETRVLGCLIEKSITTPEYYPLTLNALAAACNQKSNREPLMQLTDADVVRALDSLRDKQLAWSVTATGSRVPKYRHSLPDMLPLTPPQLAVLCELMLRGPQTVGELRTHTGRMAMLTAGGDVQATLHELAAWPGQPLVFPLARQAGQREGRYAHRLCGEPPLAQAGALPAPEPARLIVTAENERLLALEARVVVLQDELERLKAQFADFAKQLQ